MRDDEIDVLEIVDAGAADADFLDVTRNDFGGGDARSLVRDWLLCGFRRHVSKPKIIRSEWGGEQIDEKGWNFCGCGTILLIAGF